MDDVKPAILIVEDDPDIADMLSVFFSQEGYAVRAVPWGEDGIRECQSNPPDLVILDIRLPDIDGFEVARRLRSGRRTRPVPFIFLTEKRGRYDRLKGLEMQADDYITKPFDIQELRLRVRNALLRARRCAAYNPVTGMPDGILADEALAAGLQRPGTACMVVSLKNIDRFREVYGFVASDDLLRAVSIMLRDSVNETAGQGPPFAADLSAAAPGGEAFIGHLGPSDFLLITAQDFTAALSERIRKRLKQSFDYFYSDRDRQQGTFRNTQLGVTINALALSSLENMDLPHLKAVLEQFCH